MRTVVAPTNDATFVAMPFFSRNVRYSPSVVQETSYLMSPWSSVMSFFIDGLRGPIESPSPITSNVTPCRMSLCDRGSCIKDSVPSSTC